MHELKYELFAHIASPLNIATIIAVCAIIMGAVLVFILVMTAKLLRRYCSTDLRYARMYVGMCMPTIMKQIMQLNLCHAYLHFNHFKK